MKNLKYILGATSISIVLSGCLGGQPSLANLNQEEAYKYDRMYFQQYNQIKNQMANYKQPSEWIQPKNKKEECKIYSTGNKSTKSAYELYWDGECKNGYAFGLGRQIENSLYNTNETIAYFEDGKAIEYCVSYDKLKGQTIEGECGYGYDKPNLFVITSVNEKNGDINIDYQFGSNGTINTPKIYMVSSPFSDVTRYFMSYPNFTYAIDDTSNENSVSKLMFYSYNEQKMHNGYEIMVTTENEHISFEMDNNRRLRFVKLPDDYIKSRYAIYDDIRAKSALAIEAQEKALFIKEKYKNKICKDNVSVNFMDNNEYKNICNEDKYFTNLKTKINEKLERLGREKELRLAQENEQRLIKARESEVIALRRQAEASERANSQAALNNVNNMLQNMRTNTQMQMLNNNLMMYNLMPKRHDVYIYK